MLQVLLRFSSEFSRIASPLTDFTKNRSRAQGWNGECDEAIGTLKDMINDTAILMAPDWDNWSEDISMHPRMLLWEVYDAR